MVLTTKSMGLNPNVLSFAYADMSSVSSPRPTRKNNMKLGTERLVRFHSSDPDDLGIEIEYSEDGYVRIATASEDGMFEGAVHVGDIVCEIAGVNLRRPITEHMWKLTSGLMRVAPKPIEVIVAAEDASQQLEEETMSATGNFSKPKAHEANNSDAEIPQTPSLVKQAMSMLQSFNLNGMSKEEQHDSYDTESMSEGNDDSTIQLPDPFSDPERFGVERKIIFHTESLGIKLHRCPSEGIVKIIRVEQNVSDKVRDGDDDGRLEVGDVIVEVGGVDLRHKFIGLLEWADMVYFVQNVGRPLDIVVAKDILFVREPDVDNLEMNAKEQAEEEDVTDEAEEENADQSEVADQKISIIQDDKEVDDAIADDLVDEGADKNLNEEVDEDETLPSKNECCDEAHNFEHDQRDEDTAEEKSETRPIDVMATLVEQYLATKVDLSLPIESEVQMQENRNERALQRLEEELNQLPKFSPEWFSLKSELVELRTVKTMIEKIHKDEESNSSQDSAHVHIATMELSKTASLIANAPGEKMDQKKPPMSFYFRTHPDKKSSNVTANGTKTRLGSLFSSDESSRETVTTSETLGVHSSSSLTPTSIIEEDNVFEVTMWADPKGRGLKEEVIFSSTFGESLFSMDDDDAPFTGNVNFDTPSRVPASALFAQAFVVQRGDGINSPLFVVKKTLPDRSKIESPVKQAKGLKIPKSKPTLDMSDILLHQESSLESAFSTDSAWDTAAFANESDEQANWCLLDTLCGGDQMCQGLMSDSSDIRQIKAKADKHRRRRFFGKTRIKKRKDDANMLGYGSLDDDMEDVTVSKARSATAASALKKVRGKRDSGFCPMDDEVEL